MSEKRRILVYVKANKRIGLGHVYNILTILPHFKKDQVLIVMKKKHSIGYQKFKKNKLKVSVFESNSDLFNIIDNFSPHIIINDILNTEIRFIKKLRNLGCFIINFEDLGSGSNYANLVFNPIYYQRSNSNKFFGEKYACVREDFRIHYKKERGKKIVITFGGVDPRSLTVRILKLFEHYKTNYKILVIIGNEFSHKKQLTKIIKKLSKSGIDVQLIEKTDSIAKYIKNAGFAITANGRTVFEIAALKIPLITISANEREELHMFPKRNKIGYHLGLYSQVLNKKILAAIRKMENPENQKVFEKNLKKIDLQNSLFNVISTIESRYKKFENK